MFSQKEKDLEYSLLNYLGMKKYRRETTKEMQKGILYNFYSLIFDDTTKIYICSNKDTYEYHLEELVEQYKHYISQKTPIEAWIRNCLKLDNYAAEHRQLPKIEFKELRIDTDGFVVFDYYLCIDEYTKIIKTYKETFFSHFCLGQEHLNYLNNKKEFIYQPA